MLTYEAEGFNMSNQWFDWRPHQHIWHEWASGFRCYGCTAWLAKPPSEDLPDRTRMTVELMNAVNEADAESIRLMRGNGHRPRG